MANLRSPYPSVSREGRHREPRSGAAIQAAGWWARRHGRTDIDVFINEDEGHQVDDPEAFRRAREFLLDQSRWR